MPARLTLVQVPMLELITPIVINLAVLFAIFPLAGKFIELVFLLQVKNPNGPK
jgi:hypothetical protein